MRELANVIQRAFLLADGDCLRLAPDALGAHDGALEDDAGSLSRMAASFHLAREQALAEFERRFVRRALAESAGNVSLAAKRSGKERRSFGPSPQEARHRSRGVRRGGLIGSSRSVSDASRLLNADVRAKAQGLAEVPASSEVRLASSHAGHDRGDSARVFGLRRRG